MIRRILKLLAAHVDGYLACAAALLMAIGLITLYSASGESLARTGSQALNMAVAFAAMWAIAQVEPQHLMRAALPVYVLGLVLLVAVALVGDVANGARRWLNLGVTRIQPSELMKIGVPLLLAWYFARREESPRLKDYAVATLLFAAPVALIVRQPDLGTALLVAAGGFYVLFLAGLSWRVLVGFALAALASLPVLWSLLHDYQRRRILILLDPSQDPLGAGYHTIQSVIAVGSGGILGKGWLHGTQSHLDFLPERTTDFIFAVFAEEFGFVGDLALIALYLLVIARGLVIAANAPDLFTRLLAGSITLTFFTYAFVNMGMVSGILPVVGVPLPLVSYGGTSMVTVLVSFGILMSIQTHKKLVKT